MIRIFNSFYLFLSIFINCMSYIRIERRKKKFVEMSLFLKDKQIETKMIHELKFIFEIINFCRIKLRRKKKFVSNIFCHVWFDCVLWFLFFINIYFEFLPVYRSDKWQVYDFQRTRAFQLYLLQHFIPFFLFFIFFSFFRLDISCLWGHGKFEEHGNQPQGSRLE